MLFVKRRRQPSVGTDEFLTKYQGSSTYGVDGYRVRHGDGKTSTISSGE